MERLTDRSDYALGVYSDMEERLREIEDILGDEYDLDRLRDLVKADREGRCVVIDVKIGQRVWILDVGEYGDDEIAQPLGLEVYGITLSDDHETYYFVKPLQADPGKRACGSGTYPYICLAGWR